MALVTPDVAAALPSVEKDDPLSPVLSDAYDEKASMKGKDGVQVVKEAEWFPGDVYEDVREIDLDENGKEKPIESFADWSLRLISLEDDPTLPVWTFRLWFVAIGLSCFGAVLSQIFSFRPQGVYVSQLFLQTAAFGLGRGLELILPGPNHVFPLMRTRNTAFWRFVNHGRFNIKEHTGTLIMSAAATHGALAINIFSADDLFYGFQPNPAIAIFTLLGSQLLGYGLGGMMKSLLVYPTYCVYPNVVPTVQMFDVLHRNTDNFLQKKRLNFFWILFVGAFIWEWFPEYIAPLLTGVSIFCLAKRDSPWVTRVFGGAAGNEGLGLFSLCFDWNYVGSGGSAYGALFQPLQTQLSLFFGVAICCIAFSAAYANNVWNAQNFPFLTQLLFHENGTEYDQTLILNADYTLNRTSLEAVGLPWFAPSQIITKIGSSLAFGATITHLILWNGKQLIEAITVARKNGIQDAHYEKMKVYKEVPIWWYGGYFVAAMAMSLATNYTGHSQLPWWAFFVAVGWAAIFLPIITTLYAVLCYVPGTEDVAQMFGSALIPNSPHANMYFTMYAYNSTEQGRSFTRDLKIGQYVKLPPRCTFTMQTVGAIIGAMLNYVVMKIVISSNRDILLSVQGTNVWSGAAIQSYNSNAVTWGALAKDLYSPHGRYGIIPLSILIGLVVPIPFYLLHRKYPKWHFDGVITPMICTQIGALSTGINSSVFGTFILCCVSQFWIRKYHPKWFRKYNFLMSAALDGGTEVMVFVYSFAVGGAGGRVVDMPHWALNPVGNPDYCMRLT
ncbi:OPT superfamily oligopeptide transporter [Cylindrobasidium torrendii FP15055 ss-10]|uniref:OPT superfamily oligopeptide transporter n=1 Tax=Cylindrobasidium torrendii FP15055 ss-10 TaxID=1314674 RepID=A0A0D7BQU2_9AGAR|nr:OPT superfamily oligopeptide transporter [Cylindrobasidium torrendii FP15055 ss-10]